MTSIIVYLLQEKSSIPKQKYRQCKAYLSNVVVCESNNCYPKYYAHPKMVIQSGLRVWEKDEKSWKFKPILVVLTMKFQTTLKTTSSLLW